MKYYFKFAIVYIIIIILIDCKPGNYGANCEQKCSSKCNEYKCDQYTGICLQGCSPGYVAPNCAESNEF